MTMTPSERAQIRAAADLLANVAVHTRNPVEATCVQVLGWLTREVADSVLSTIAFKSGLQKVWEGPTDSDQTLDWRSDDEVADLRATLDGYRRAALIQERHINALEAEITEARAIINALREREDRNA
jgi:hypothetical protein